MNFEGLIEYVNESYMLYRLKQYCAYGNWEHTGYIGRDVKPIHKYNNARAKRILEKKYIVAIVGGMGCMYCFFEKDLESFKNDFFSDIVY